MGVTASFFQRVMNVIKFCQLRVNGQLALTDDPTRGTQEYIMQYAAKLEKQQRGLVHLHMRFSCPPALSRYGYYSANPWVTQGDTSARGDTATEHAPGVPQELRSKPIHSERI